MDIRIRHLSLGNVGDIHPVGEGVSELRIHYGPGYRIYLKQQGDVLVILLAGGDKSSQDQDIRLAKDLARNLLEISMTKTTTTIWDPASHLSTEDDVVAYLEAALQDGDPQLVAAALGDIARAKGLSQIAREAGLGRESLYKSLSSSGNPELATVLKVISALGLQLHVSPTDKAKMAV
jgi:probable addiction module antidote protein/putative addiction module killer protein